MPELFRGKGEKQGIFLGAKPIFFSEFLRGNQRLQGILEGLSHY